MPEMSHFHRLYSRLKVLLNYCGVRQVAADTHLVTMVTFFGVISCHAANEAT